MEGDHIVHPDNSPAYCGRCARGIGSRVCPGADGLMHRHGCPEVATLAKKIEAVGRRVDFARAPSLASPLGDAPLATVAPTTSNKIAVATLWGIVAVGVGTLGWLLWKGPPMLENPAPVRRTPNVGRSPPIVKGRSTRFEMKDGPDVTCAGGMIHDPSGRAWPRNSILCGPFRPRVRTATPEEYRGWAKDYLGSSHRPMVGVVDVPPRALSEWQLLGEVEKIYYTRLGKKRPGRYVHAFYKPTALATLVRGRGGKVKLYRRGRFVRLELPKGAHLDARGFVYP